MDCIFCKIIKNEIPSFTIYEDEQVKVILDINPNTNADSLIIPKKHIKTINDLDDELIIHIGKVAKKMYKLLKEKTNCDGLTITQNNDFGQEIKHYHVHLTPRYQNDNLTIQSNKKELVEIEEIYKKLTA